MADKIVMEQLRKIGRWIRSLSMTTVWLVVFWYAALLAANHFGLGDYLQLHVASKVNFNVRRALKGEAPLDPRLKIFAIDDATAALRGETRLSGRALADLLQAIDARKPSKILIDAMFSLRQEVGTDAEQTVARIAALQTPVVTAAMMVPSAISYRTETTGDKLLTAWTKVGRLPSSIMSVTPAKIYGPEGAYMRAFSHIGHVSIDIEQYMAPAILVNESILAPHMSLYAAKDIAADDGALLVDGQQVPIDARGLVPIDFSSPAVINQRIFSLRDVFSGNSSVLNNITPGDVVLILTEYTSGGTKFLNSPFGLLPSPFSLIAAIDTVLKGRWLRSTGHSTILVLTLTTIGLMLGMTTATNVFFLWLTEIAAAFIALFLHLFMALGIEVPWALPMVGLIGAALIGYGEQRRKDSVRRMFLESERHTAAVLQRDFLPPPHVQHARFDLAATYMAAETIGGDWYAHGLIADRWLYLHLGDVTGHGAASAMLASFAKGATDALHEAHNREYQRPAPLGLVHDCINTVMRTSSGENLFMTMNSMIIDLSTGEFKYLNSGHEPAILMADREITILSRPVGNLLGHSMEPQDQAVGSGHLGNADTIILFSDGLLDATCPPGKKPSLRLLTKLLHNVDYSDAKKLQNVIELRCKLQLKSSRKSNFSDDVTFVVVKLRQRTDAADLTRKTS